MSHDPKSPSAPSVRPTPEIAGQAGALALAPGSASAAAAGCNCPVMDNGRGRGWMGVAGLFVMRDDCPLHGTTKSRQPDHMHAGNLPPNVSG